MYTYKTTVSYSRLDKEGKVPLHEILNYLQDCSTAQSEALGVGIEYMKEKNKAWVLLANKVQIFIQPRLGDEIEVGTCPVDFGKVMATRQFFIKDSQGNFMVKAESIWSLIDITQRMPIRIQAEDTNKYTQDIAFDSINTSRKIRFNSPKEQIGEWLVKGFDIDTNGHVNNANYLRTIYDYIPKDLDYNQIEIVYNKEAMLGEKVLCSKYNEEGAKGFSLESEDGELHAQIKISKI